MSPSFSLLAATFPSNPLVSVLVAVALFGVSIPIARRVATQEGDPVLARLMLVSVTLHMLCAPAQIWVVNHLYHGVADYTGYVSHGAALATNWRSGNFTLAGSGVTSIVGDGAVSIAAGLVMSVVGVDQLAAFFVFAWLSFVGTVLFYRAFAITFPEASHRRYAILIFFLPSLLFWTADASKEAVMTFSLGIVAYGIARVMARLPGGFPLVALGTAIGLGIRPNELVLLLVGFAIAIVLRPPPGRREAIGLRRLGATTFVVTIVIVALVLNARLLHSAGGGGGGITGILTRVAKNNTGTGAGFGSSAGPYSPNPLLYPRDIYQLLFDPLPFSAHNVAQVVAAIENTIILGVVLSSYRQLRIVLRAARERPYVLVALLYSAGFLYAFAALDNLGLITRERTLLLPFLLVMLAIPLAPQGTAPYVWERRRRERTRDFSIEDEQPELMPDGWNEWVPQESLLGEWVPTEMVPAEWVADEWSVDDEWSVASWEALEGEPVARPTIEDDPRAGGYRPAG